LESKKPFRISFLNRASLLDLRLLIVFT
jgi:hypothetical protein